LKAVIDILRTDLFCKSEPGIFEPIIRSLLDDGDTYCAMADFRSYLDAQEKVDKLYQMPEEWVKKALLNVARIGKFSSDRTIKEYANDIWHIKQVMVDF